METCHYIRLDYMSPLKRRPYEHSSRPSFAFPALASTKFHTEQASRHTKGTKGKYAHFRRRWSSASTAIGVGRGFGIQEEEGPLLQDIAALLFSCEQLKAMVESSSNSGIGPDMRNRVDQLLNRVGMLKEGVDRAVRVGAGRVPSQLIAVFQGLQREHNSLENIVRLATKAGPVLAEQCSSKQDGLSSAPQKDSLSIVYGTNSMEVEHALTEKNEATVEVLRGPTYVMSTPSTEASPKLSSVRAEIERRVTEQLLKKQPTRPLFFEGQEFNEGKENRRATFEIPNVLEDGNIESAPFVAGGKDFLPQNVKEGSSTPGMTPDINAPEARVISLELHKQMVSVFQKALHDVQRQLSDVMAELKQKDDMLIAVKEKLSNEHDELSEKVTELSAEVARRFTAKELNLALGKSQEDTQSQVLSLGSKLEIANRAFVAFQEDQRTAARNHQEVVSSLINRLCLLEDAHKEFVSLNVPAGIASVKAIVSHLQDEQVRKEAEIASWQEKLRDVERLLLINDNKIEKVRAEIEKGARREDMEGLLQKVLGIVGKESKQLQDRANAFGLEHKTLETIVGSLQKDLKTCNDERKHDIDDMASKLRVLETKQQRLMVQDVGTELSKLKEKLNTLQDQLMGELDNRAMKMDVHDALQKVVSMVDVEQQHLQSRVEALGMAQERNEASVGLLQEECRNLGQELKVRMENEVSRLEGIQKRLVTEYTIPELSKVKDDVIALHKELSAKVDSTATKQELTDVVKKVEDMLSMLEATDKRHVAEDVMTELSKVKVIIVALQEELMERGASKQELSDVMKKVEDIQAMQKEFVAKDVIIEISRVTDNVTALQKELLADVERRASKQELSEVVKKVGDMVSTKLEAVQERFVAEDVVRQVSNIKDKVMALQEEWGHQQALIEAARQQSAMREDEGSDLLTRVRKEVEAHRQLLPDEVRGLVAELLEASQVIPSTRVLNDHTKSTASSEESLGDISSVGKHGTILHTEEGQFSDKRTAFLETFFAVMGQLIRQELEKMNVVSASQTLGMAMDRSADSGYEGQHQGKNEIMLLYDSSWDRVFIHYCADNLGWTEVPGVPMQELKASNRNSRKMFKIRAAKLEFVLTDGQGKWDRAPNGCNYVVDRPGFFELSAGNLRLASMV